MQEWYILGVGKGALFREVSSVQGCPYRGVRTVYTNILWVYLKLRIWFQVWVLDLVHGAFFA